MRTKASELKVGDIINIYQEWSSSKIDCEIEAIIPVDRPTQLVKDKKFFMVCFKDNYTEGQTLIDVVLREDREVMVVTVEDRIKGLENYFRKSYNYSEIEISNLRDEADGTPEGYLNHLERVLNEIQADAYETLGERRMMGLD